MLILVEHPLCAVDLTVVRDQGSDHTAFRAAMQRIGLHVCLQATRHLPVEPVAVETPLEQTTGYRLYHRIVAVPILRAGLLFLDPMLQVVPTAYVGFIGLRRQEDTLQVEHYYWRMPPLDERTAVVVLDPMLATGGSATAALLQLMQAGAQEITIACAIAAPEGVERIATMFPAVRIVAAALDRQLNAHGFIVPGLGDAGDRAFGTE
ncbi:MAG: uracil phosphoribosyltransferase [Bacteroidota bacterium]|nr:uracil phosphoribosyltransferase [Candidatus Kapabacteria bacterium]MCX7937558.1 uracil phosphoribosyltransferase [Chlorobiota bacterium]MDW8075913.1 uracil phosphoribosyltransferase [Bacteroidota bacterium]MDW8271731.1 uracil phosphoribosyltransferase [Bacteroidota bacterium]